MGQLRETVARATISNTHGFLWVLHCKNKLLRIYTQNIDGLERRIGIPLVESPNHQFLQGGYVPLHGTLTQLICTRCLATRFFGEVDMKVFQSGKAPDCSSCLGKGESNSYFYIPKTTKTTFPVTDPRLRQRPIGQLRPNVVLYNEHHPKGDEISDIVKYDLRQKPSMLIVMGTTLSIPSLREYTKMFVKEVHAGNGLVVFVNKEKLGVKMWEEAFDYMILGDVDKWVMEAANYWHKKKPDDWSETGKVDSKTLSRYKLMEQVDLLNTKV